MKISLLITSICVASLVTRVANAENVHAFFWDGTNGMQDLGALGGGSSYAQGINDSGQVVGYSYTKDNDHITTHAFLWSVATGMVDMGTPGGKWSRAEAINSLGNVVGEGEDGGGLQVPFYWSPGTGFVTLGGNPRVGVPNFAYGINDRNEVTGQRLFDGQLVHAFFWAPRLQKPRDLGILSGGFSSSGYAINNLTHIVGTGDDGTGYFALGWTKLRGFQILGAIPDEYLTRAVANNDNDEAVGYGLNGQRAFYWSRSTDMQLLQPLGGLDGSGFAYAINESGVIAGASYDMTGNERAVIWASYAGAPQDLGTLPGGTFAVARAINDLGQVVGYSEVIH